MSVHQLKDGRWIVHYRIDRKPKREYFGRGFGAEKEARERDTALSLMKHTKKTALDKSPLFSELAEQYLAGRIASIEPTTYSVLKYKLKAILLPEFGDTEALKITKDRLDKYVLKRQLQGKKNTTIRRDIADIQAVMYFAVERRLISHNPLAQYKKPRKDTEIFSPPSTSEMVKINKHAPEHLRRALKIIYYTGARPGSEITNLKWANVLWDQDCIRIVSARKHGAPFRDIPLFKDFRKFLKRWLKEDKKQNVGKDIADINIIRYRGKPVLSIKRSWGRAKRLAEITRPIIPYSYRHAFASWLLDNGAVLKDVSQLLGHSSPTLTLAVYQHTSKASHRRAIDKLPAVNW